MHDDWQKFRRIGGVAELAAMPGLEGRCALGVARAARRADGRLVPEQEV